MSPVGKEMHYKNGMKKDTDGFTDIDWCSSAVLNSWDDLRRAFRAANARKAIAPTQASCRGRPGGDTLLIRFLGRVRDQTLPAMLVVLTNDDEHQG